MLTAFCFVAAALITVKHCSNLRRIWYSAEPRLGDTPTMMTLTKTIHVLALGLWFGSIVFFTFIAALVIFHTFEGLGASPDRPTWIHESFAKEQGTQLAGLAVGPIFPWYFLLQGVCGLLAGATAFSWSRQPGRVHRLRCWVLGLAFLGVVAGWPLAVRVSELRAGRYDANLGVRAAAREDFGRWHGYSLGLNLLTILLVGTGMALAGQLPETRRSS